MSRDCTRTERTKILFLQYIIIIFEFILQEQFMICINQKQQLEICWSM